jgi:hypothetical protein
MRIFQETRIFMLPEIVLSGKLFGHSLRRMEGECGESEIMVRKGMADREHEVFAEAAYLCGTPSGPAFLTCFTGCRKMDDAVGV